MRNECLYQSGQSDFSQRDKINKARAWERGQKIRPTLGDPSLPAGHDQGIGTEARPKTAPVLGDVGEGKLGKSFVSCQGKLGNLGAAATRVIRPGLV